MRKNFSLVRNTNICEKMAYYGLKDVVFQMDQRKSN